DREHQWSIRSIRPRIVHLSPQELPARRFWRAAKLGGGREHAVGRERTTHPRWHLPAQRCVRGGLAVSVLDALRHELLDEATVDALLDRLEQRQAMREPDGWLRGAEKIAAYIDCPPSRV